MGLVGRQRFELAAHARSECELPPSALRRHEEEYRRRTGARCSVLTILRGTGGNSRFKPIAARHRTHILRPNAGTGDEGIKSVGTDKTDPTRQAVCAECDDRRLEDFFVIGFSGFAGVSMGRSDAK